LENIIYQLQTDQIPRIRLGIADSDYKRPSEKYVLKPFNKDSMGKVENMVQHCADAIQTLIAKGLDHTMNQFNS
jgi:PTH1 family peptidyl-tRNA hydrolase